VSVKSNYAT